MSEQISFVIDNKKYFTAFGAEGLLAEHLVDSNVVEQSVLIGSSALTRSYGRLYPGGTIAVPTVTVSDYTMDGKYFILTGERGGVSYQLTRDGIIKCDSTEEMKEGSDEVSEDSAISVEELMGNSALNVSAHEPVSVVEEQVMDESIEDTKQEEPVSKSTGVSEESQEVTVHESSVAEQPKEVVVSGAEAPSNVSAVSDDSVEERRAALRELLRNSNAGLQFGKRSAEAKPASLQIGRKGEAGFVYQANTSVRQKGVQISHMEGRADRRYARPLQQSNYVVEEVKAPIQNKPLEVKEHSVKTVSKPKKQDETVQKVNAVPKSWLTQHGYPETDAKPKPFARPATSGMDYLNDLYNGVKNNTSLREPVDTHSIETPKVHAEPIKCAKESVPDLAINPVTSEDKEKRLQELMSEQSDDVRIVLQKAPILLFGNAVRQFTTHPIDEEKLAEERSGYCIDNRWYKCGDWFAIDVIPHTARYIYNCKLGVSIEIPRSVHREYFTLNSQE